MTMPLGFPGAPGKPGVNGEKGSKGSTGEHMFSEYLVQLVLLE